MKAGGGEGRAMLRLGPFWERRFQEFPRVGRALKTKIDGLICSGVIIR